MKYTDAEVDAVALAMHEACQTTMPGYSDDRWRTAARAALAARDALFETVGERWDVYDDGSGYWTTDSKAEAHETARKWREQGFDGVRVVHITTKRRKQR